MTDFEIGWCAGIIDGEGCIRIQRHTFGLVVIVGSTNLEMLLKLRDLWGGNISPKKSGIKEHWKPYFLWQITGRKAFPMLESILPHLVVKQKQATIALGLKDLLCKQNNYKEGANEEYRRQRHELYMELKRLNAKGVIEDQDTAEAEWSKKTRYTKNLTVN
jgi:hypothetical protein